MDISDVIQNEETTMELESFKEDPDSTSVHSSIKEYNTNQTDQEGMIQNVFHS